MVNCVRLTWLFVGWDLLHGCGLQSTPDGSMQSDRAREVPRGCRNAGWISSSYECLRLTRSCSYVLKIVCSFLCYKFIRHSVILQSIWASLRVGKALLTCSHQPPWLPQRRNHASIRCSATRNSHAPPSPQKKKQVAKHNWQQTNTFLPQKHLCCPTPFPKPFVLKQIWQVWLRHSSWWGFPHDGSGLQPATGGARSRHKPYCKEFIQYTLEPTFFAPENGWLE